MLRLILSLMTIGALNLTHAQDHVALLGTYTGDGSRGIYSVRINAETGALSHPELVAELPNPEFLALHPNGRFVYALTQGTTSDGGRSAAVAAFEVDRESGQLTALNTELAARGALTHLAIDETGSMAIAASYGGAYVVSFPIKPDGSLGPRASFIQHEGRVGPGPRQNAPYPHSVTISPGNRIAFVADLGLDRVFPYRIDPEDGTLSSHEPALVTVAPGAGPRHTAFSPDGKSFYVLNELDGTITSCRFDSETGIAEPFERVSTLPDDFTGRNTTSEIRVHPGGRFVYAANRGHDSLAVFERNAESGALTRLEVVPCGGEQPRNFSLTPDGAWLLSAHQNSNDLTLFKVDLETGRLTATPHTVPAPTPVCVLFLQ